MKSFNEKYAYLYSPEGYYIFCFVSFIITLMQLLGYLLVSCLLVATGDEEEEGAITIGADGKEEVKQNIMR
jgi:hypothetical protein